MGGAVRRRPGRDGVGVPGARLLWAFPSLSAPLLRPFPAFCRGPAGASLSSAGWVPPSPLGLPPVEPVPVAPSGEVHQGRVVLPVQAPLGPDPRRGALGCRRGAPAGQVPRLWAIQVQETLVFSRQSIESQGPGDLVKPCMKPTSTVADTGWVTGWWTSSRQGNPSPL